MKDISNKLLKDVSILFEITEEKTGVTREEILSRNRKTRIQKARMIMGEVLRRNSIYTLSDIGKSICGLDHSTILHYRSKVLKCCEKDEEFKKNFTSINIKFKTIQEVGYPLEKKLEFAIKERDNLNKEIRKMKKMLNL